MESRMIDALMLLVCTLMFALRYSKAEFTTEVPMTWSGMEGDDQTHLLPDEIHIDLDEVVPDLTTRKLHLVRKHEDVEAVQVITGHRGKERNWKMRKHQHFSVYSDQSALGSFSVSVDDRDVSKMMMFGSFVLDSQAFSIAPLRHSFATAGHLISINGSLHVITRGGRVTHEQMSFDTLGERHGYYEYEYLDGYNYILTELEFGLNNEMFRRHRGKQNLTVELFVVLDYSIYKKWLDHSRGSADAAISGLRFYFSHIVNGMNDRYESIDHPDFRISIKPAGYYIARTRNDAPFTEESEVKMNNSAVQAYKALDRFYKWILKRVKSQKGEMPRFDASALFTEYTLLATDTGSRTISGLADIGAICKINSVSINKDFGQYGTIDTATHELGHNLGALHDGSNNTCTSNDQFIMATSPFVTEDSLFFNPYKFSPCSIKYLKEHFAELNRLGKNCLLDGEHDEEEQIKHLNELPGQKFSIDDQCKLVYGKDSFYCGGGGDHGKAICRGMFCYRPSSKACLTDIRLRAADGTPCDNKSWCLRSRCVHDERAPEIDATCPHGDYKGKIPNWNGGHTDCQTIGTKQPPMCYHAYYENLCCDTCKKLRIHRVKGCEYGDRNKTACTLMPLSYCYDSNVMQECCETCALREIKGAGPDCKFGDKASWCTNEGNFKKSGCYREADRSLCCKTCQDYLIGPPGCEYGDKGEGCQMDVCHSDSHRLYCCKTCNVYGDPMVGNSTLASSTTTTTTTTTKKSASTAALMPFIAAKECTKDSASWCVRIKPYECYRSNVTCCLTCLQYHEPANVGCEYGDRKDSCGPDKCSRGKWYVDNCCKSCAYKTTPTTTTTMTTTKRPATTTMIPSTTTTTSTTTARPTTTTATTTTKATTTVRTTSKTNPKCPRGDLASWCAGIKAHECYRTSHICCSTCLDFRDESSSSCPYGDRRGDCKSNHCQHGHLRHDCCRTCSNLSSTTTTTTATPTTATTKSNAIVEILPDDVKHCRKDKLAWCPQLSSHECYLYVSDCCGTCSRFYNESHKGCEFGDREALCAPSSCYDSQYSKICCKTCGTPKPELSRMKVSVVSSTTRTTPTTTITTRTTPTTTTTPITRATSPHPKCPRGDTASWCANIKSYDCYTSAHICCLSCLKYLDESTKECRYGDRRSQCDVTKCDRIYAYYCCRTCSNGTHSTLKLPTTTAKQAPTTTSTTTTTTTTTTQLPTTTSTTRKPEIEEDDVKQKCPNGDLASWCSSLKPYDCYKSSKTCCVTCLQYYDKSAANDDCEYGDKVSWCENHVKKSTEDCKRPTSNVATKCCKSCREAFNNDPEYLILFSYVRPSCSHGDEASFCRNMDPSSCYSNYKTCCRTCASYFDSTIPECPYGDKVGWCKAHANSVESCNRKDIASRCCHTCFYLTSNGNFTQSVSGCDDIAEWCKNIVARQCYQPRAEFTCCNTCRKLRKKRIGECRYGNHVSWCEPQFCSSHYDECCETCA